MTSFETHITFRVDHPEDLAGLKTQGKEKGMKCTHIVLDQGNHSSQPMLTRHSEGALQSEIEAAHSLANQLEQDGIQANRIKLEVAASSDLVPTDLEDPRLGDSNFYFEYHIKFQAKHDYPLSNLLEKVVQQGARLSKNNFKTDSQILQRFATLRAFNCLLPEAEQKFQSLLAVVQSEPVEVLEIEKEYVVYDSNFDLDAGWLEPQAHNPL